MHLWSYLLVARCRYFCSHQSHNGYFTSVNSQLLASVCLLIWFISVVYLIDSKTFMDCWKSSKAKWQVQHSKLCLPKCVQVYLNIFECSLRAQTALHGVVALRYQCVDNKVPQLHAMLSEPLDYFECVPSMLARGRPQLLLIPKGFCSFFSQVII